MAEAFDTLLAAMHDELDALDSGDATVIGAATAAKLAALTAARSAPPVAVKHLYEASALNALAATRVNMLMAGVDRRLAALTAADGRGGGLCYGRDGRTMLAR